MENLTHSFGPWEQSSDNAGFLRELLAHPQIWEQQRTDAASLPVAINAAHAGAYLSIFRRVALVGFALFIPQKCGLYEMHVGFENVSALEIRDCIRNAVSEMFESTDAAILAAPCPDWNMGLLRLARVVKKALLAGRKPNFEPYRVKHLARRVGEDFGATIFPFSRGEWNRAHQKRKETTCH